MSASYTYEEEEDRLNRFLAPNGTAAPETMAGRAASQPPRSPSAFNRSPSTQHFIPASVSSSHRSAIPIGNGRSSSFTAREHGFAPRSISSSTFEEEDEDDLFPEYSSSYDNRGRPTANDAYSRSRSQSLAPVTGRPIASPPTISRFGSAYDTFLHTRFNSGPSPGNRDNNIDLSNMSPFFRDILHDDSTFQENGGGSGTTSRRHSVSIVQPRSRNIGFNAPPQRSPENSPSVPYGSFRGGFVGANVGAGKGGGLGISDEELADFDFGFNNMSINGGHGHGRDRSSSGSLPSGASPFQPRKLHIPSGSPTAERFSARGPELTARFIPGQGIQYLPQDFGYQQQAPRYQPHQTPLSPTHAYNGAQQQQQDVGLGKGVPLHAVPSAWPLFIVEFKAGRTDLFYYPNTDPHSASVRIGDVVVVEADRGKDLGTVVNDSITVEQIEQWQAQQQQQLLHQAHDGDIGVAPPPPSSNNKEINPKRMYGKAGKQDVNLLAMKGQDEMKALQLCQSKVRARKLPMEVVDAEYQWDRKKLTFYFVAEKRIDFRELVRELFRLYKTRIWMASLNGPPGALNASNGEQQHQ